MEFLNNVKWYHIAIVCLVGILAFLVFTRNNCTQNSCKNAPAKSEGFTSDKLQQKQEPKQDTKQAEIILYYAMWCGHSKSFLPEWEKFEEYAKKNLPYIRVSRVRCEDGNEATCMQKGVEGYPTVIMYLNSGEEKTFDGNRTFDGLVSFIQQNVQK